MLAGARSRQEQAGQVGSQLRWVSWTMFSARQNLFLSVLETTLEISRSAAWPKCPQRMNGGLSDLCRKCGLLAAWKQKAGCLRVQLQVGPLRAAGSRELRGPGVCVSVWLLPHRGWLCWVAAGASFTKAAQEKPAQFPQGPQRTHPRAQVLVGQQLRFLCPWPLAWLSPTASGRSAPEPEI